jgi:NAD(P)H-dependent FMN reductase
MARLLVNPGTPHQWAILLREGISRVGSSADCDIQIQHDSLASVACEIAARNDGLNVKDLGFGSGIAVDGASAEEVTVRGEQRFQVGEVELEFESEQSPAVRVVERAPTPEPPSRPQTYVPDEYSVDPAGGCQETEAADQEQVPGMGCGRRRKGFYGVSRLDPARPAEHSLGVLTLIAGTNRPASNTRKVALLAEQAYASLGVGLRVLDLQELPGEVFSPSAYADKPKAFAPFAEAVLQAEGLIVVTPEYNGGVPGVLKYFIDLLEFPESFDRRPVCFIGLAAGRWGALRPVEQLQLIFGYRNAYLFPERLFLPEIHELLDESGAFKDPALSKRLHVQAEGFIDFVERQKSVKLRPTK